jgi:lysophospholipid acyltransferase 5
VSRQHAVIQNAYFAACGLLIYAFNYGWQTGHCLLCIAVQYATILVCGSSPYSPAFSMAFQLTYLLWGYWCTSTEDYDISWTLPHCVLTLRLVGVAFDYYDGQKEPVGIHNNTARKL